MNSRSTRPGGSANTATRVAIPRRTRSAASSTPGPSASVATTIMSAGSTGSLTSSTHPAARRSDSLVEGAPTMTAPTRRTTAKTLAQRSRRAIMPLDQSPRRLPPRSPEASSTSTSSRTLATAKMPNTTDATGNELADHAESSCHPQCWTAGHHSGQTGASLATQIGFTKSFAWGSIGLNGSRSEVPAGGIGGSAETNTVGLYAAITNSSCGADAESHANLHARAELGVWARPARSPSRSWPPTRSPAGWSDSSRMTISASGRMGRTSTTSTPTV
jgi:hypothetical protein